MQKEEPLRGIMRKALLLQKFLSTVVIAFGRNILWQASFQGRFELKTYVSRQIIYF
jgi:hypothetical protein